MDMRSGEAMNLPEAADSTTVDRILANALEHFSRFGYTGASVREITHASEVTKPTLYYYFKNKEELYKKLAETCFAEVWQTIEAASKFQGSTTDRAISIMREYCKLIENKYTVVRFVHLMLMAGERQSPDVGVHALAAKIRALYGQLVQEGIANGEVKGDRAESTTYSLVAIFNMRVETLVNKFPEMADMSVVEEAIRFALHPCPKES